MPQKGTGTAVDKEISLGGRRLVLASTSPRRSQLLAERGFVFTVMAPDVNETAAEVGRLPAARQAEMLAELKAGSVADRVPGAVVLGADTVVALGARILGKPAGAGGARRMLGSLSGTRHAVMTGVAVVWPSGWRQVASETTFVTMRPMTPGEIDDYISSGEWIGKAGAYAIQESADRFVERVEGSFTNVVGLPMELVGRLLGEGAKHEGPCH